MAKWTLPEGKLYTQADLDAAVAAALKEAAEAIDCGCSGWCMHPDKCPKEDVEAILALIPDAGEAFDLYVEEKTDDAYFEGFADGAAAERKRNAVLIPDAGAALARALAAQIEKDAKVAETHPMRFAGQTEDAVRAALAAAIRAQKENPDG